ncbi:MAG: HAMP domain-containing protein, partial [Chloroflexi bacterium]|nr:HAMP domain-containing protein [Chloroflexota bacterium]
MLRMDPTPRPIRTYLLGALLLVSIIPLLVLTSISIWNLSRRGEDEARERLLDTAFYVASHIDDYIDQHMSAVVSLTTDLNLRERSPDDCERALRAHHGAFDGFITMLVANRDGDAVATSPVGLNKRGPVNVSDREYFRTPMHTQQTYVSDVFRGRGFGTDPIVALSAPVHDSSGGVVGVAEGSLNVNKLARITSRPGSRPDTHVLIVDRQDRVVFSEGARYAFLQPLADTSLMRRVHESPSPSFRHEEGRDLVAVHRTRTGWRVVASQPTSAVQREVSGSVARALTWLLVAVLISVALAHVTAYRVTRPLGLLVGSVQAVDAKGLTAPVTPRFRSAPIEVLELAESFDSMSTRLATSYRDLRQANRELEQGVAERTEELARTNRTLEEEIVRKNAAQATLVLRDRAIAAASDGVVIIDAIQPGTPAVYVNPGFERLTGYSSDEIYRGT